MASWNRSLGRLLTWSASAGRASHFQLVKLDMVFFVALLRFMFLSLCKLKNLYHYL